MIKLKYQYIIFILFGFIISLSACKKDKKITEPTNTGESNLVFTIKSIEEMEDIKPSASQPKSKSSMSSSRSKEDHLSLQTEIVELNGIDAIMSVTEDLPEQYPGKPKLKTNIYNKGLKKSSGNNKAERITSQLPDGATYRVVIFQTNSDGQATSYVTQGEGIVGSTPITLGVSRKTKYRWYAYTYNNNSPIDTLNPANGNVPVLASSNSDSKRQDFAYATGLIITQDIIGASQRLNNIVLTRKTARIVVEVNSRGMFAEITNASPIFKDNSGLVKGEFRMQDSSFQNISALIGSDHVYNHHSSGFSVPVGTDSVPKTDWKRRYTFYTPADGETARALNISLDTLQLRSERLKDSDGSVDYRTRTFYNTVFSFPAFIPQAGKSYFLSIKLVESAILISGVRWARSNVYRDISTPQTAEGVWEYRFRYDNPLYQTTAAVPSNTDYFMNDIYRIVRGKNICELIYPEDTWDLPTVDDFSILDNLSGKQVAVQDNGWYLYIVPTTNPAGFPGYPHKNLIFTPIGYRSNTNSGISDFYPNSIRYRDTKGYWRTKIPGSFAQFNFTTSQQGMINVSTFITSRLACVRCIRKR